jgi:hypothetical protein
MEEHINIILSKRQVKYLIEVLEDCQDSGPIGSGWKSNELINIINRIKLTA